MRAWLCHTVHHASGVTPLWNHSMSSVSNYVVYSSARLNSLNLTIPDFLKFFSGDALSKPGNWGRQFVNLGPGV